MAERDQTYQNHARLFPLFHMVVLPIMAGNLLYSLYRLVTAPSLATVWGTIFAFGLLALALTARVMALTVQDRVIRLEMQLRLMRVLPPDLQGRVAALKREQFVALRFAGDDELPDLVREVADGRLHSQKEIKLRVKHWQSDWLRA